MQYPTIIPPPMPEMLDAYLANGWYRSGQHLFTLDYTYIDRWIRVFWLRYRMSDFRLLKSHQDILRRNQSFSVEIRPFQLTLEYEQLYQKYLQGVDFDTSDSLLRLLFGSPNRNGLYTNVFQSYSVEVRDAGQLIGLGVFDVGSRVASGIVNVFDPSYRKYSLGKFLILQKLLHAQAQNMPWFYPGYIGHDFPKLDYKLFTGMHCIELYDPVDEDWIQVEEGLVEKLTENQKWMFEPVPDGTDSDPSTCAEMDIGQ